MPAARLDELVIRLPRDGLAHLSVEQRATCGFGGGPTRDPSFTLLLLEKEMMMICCRMGGRTARVMAAMAMTMHTCVIPICEIGDGLVIRQGMSECWCQQAFSQ
jgi:hypothetical protein